MKNDALRKTESLCPECLSRIPARIVSSDGNVYLEKECPQHGCFRVIVWHDPPESYMQWGVYGGKAMGTTPVQAFTDINRGCPFDCGICPQHEQGTASAAIMSTNQCNLDCPICFTHDADMPLYEPDIADVTEMLRTVFDTCGNIPIEFCGGEPTVREDLPELISTAAAMGFDHIQINTNGIRIARDRSFLEHMRSAGATTIYLQFDGMDNGIYRQLRGADLFELKCEAVLNCAAVRIGVVLVPMVVKGVNEHQLGEIIRFAKSWIPTVKGVYFQPMSYFGKYPKQPTDEDRLTIPDMLRFIEAQTGGEWERHNFFPPACEHPYCSFSGFAILKDDGSLLPTSHLRARSVDEAGVERARNFTRQYWRHHEQTSSYLLSPQPQPVPVSLAQHIQERSFFVSGMLFQDVWNIDLERLKRCCIHIVTQDQRMIPLCAKYLTSIGGNRLFPGIA